MTNLYGRRLYNTNSWTVWPLRQPLLTCVFVIQMVSLKRTIWTQTLRLRPRDLYPSSIGKYKIKVSIRESRTLYCTALTLVATDTSSPTLSLLSIAPKPYPVIVKHVTWRDPGPSDRCELPTEFKYNICCAKFSPVSSAALLITRSGSIKLGNCAAGANKASIAAITNERVDEKQLWRYCSLAISDDGNRGFATDRRKYLVFEFEARLRASI